MCDLRRALAAMVVAGAAVVLCTACPDNGGGDGGESGDTTPPTAPAGLAAVVASSSRIDLTWSASSDDVGVAGYHVQRDGTRVASPSGTSWSDTGRTANTRHCYTVTAYDAAGNVSAPCDAQCATTGDAAPAFPGFELALAEGTTWKYQFDYTAVSSAMGSGTETYEAIGAFWLRLGAPRTIQGVQAYALEAHGNHHVPESGETKLGPRWKYLASNANRLLGSTDGATLTTIFDAQKGSWPGGGFFCDFSSTLASAKAATFTNDYVSGPAVLAERSASQDQCEYFPGIGPICGDSSYNYRDVDAFRAGVGPLGAYYERSYSDCGGGFCSSGKWTKHIGLVASTLAGDPPPIDEVEPNDAAESPQPVGYPTTIFGSAAEADPGFDATVVWQGATYDTRFHDIFTFTLDAATRIHFVLYFGETFGNDFDLYIWYASTGALGASNADNPSTGDYREGITADLPAGSYFVAVSAYSGSGGYALDLR